MAALGLQKQLQRLTWVLPQVELVRFIDVGFSPPWLSPEELSQRPVLCIGSKARTIGDTLMLSSLPRKLKEKYPNLKITTYPRGFNRYVFAQNPYVDHVSYLPGVVYGDDSNFGEGQLLQLKEQYFGLEVSSDPKPDIYLNEVEQTQVRKLRAYRSKPVCVIHPWGHTWKKVLDEHLWDSLVSRWRNRVDFWQVGIEGHRAIVGCTRVLLNARGYSTCRSMFETLAASDFFIGINSGPMHAARAFEKPSLILIEEGKPEQLFKRRKSAPYYLYDNFRQAFLYEKNEHLNVPDYSAEVLGAQVDTFIESQIS